MERIADEKQDTLRELKTLQEAYAKFKDEKWESKMLSNKSFYTDEAPICPEPPKKPPEPQSEPFETKDYYSWRDSRENPTVRRSAHDKKNEKWNQIGGAFVALGFFVFIFTIFFAIQNGLWIIPILCVMGIAVGFFLVSVPRITKKKNDALFQKESIAYYTGKYRPEQERKEKERLKEWDHYQKTVLPPYNQALAEYNEKKAEYDAAIEKRESEATRKREEESSRRMNEAQKAFDQTRAKLSVEISEKYYEDLADIIAILEDGRADTVKEAIAVLLDDKHKEAMLEEQRRLVYEQKEQNRELKRQGQEQAEFQMQMQQEQERFRQRQEEMQEEENHRRQMRQMEEDRRIEAEESARRDREQKAKAQCFSCGKNQRFPKCPMAGTVDSVCPNYVPYHL